jgi:hypothetical protein
MRAAVPSGRHSDLWRAFSDPALPEGSIPTPDFSSSSSDHLAQSVGLDDPAPLELESPKHCADWDFIACEAPPLLSGFDFV